MIVELADHEFMRPDGGPAQHQVRERLHGALPLSYALPMVAAAGIRQVLGVYRGDLLLDLQKQRIPRAVAFEQHHVIPHPDAAGPHYFETHVQASEGIEEMDALRPEALAVGVQGAQNFPRVVPSKPPEERPLVAESRASAASGSVSFFRRSKGRARWDRRKAA